jgi:hypothetical protein
MCQYGTIISSMKLFAVTDMTWEVMRRLQFGDRYNFGRVNKFIHDFYMQRRMGLDSVAGISVYLGKKELMEEMMSGQRIVSLTAPSSYGKTIVGLGIPFLHFHE